MHRKIPCAALDPGLCVPVQLCAVYRLPLFGICDGILQFDLSSWASRPRIPSRQKRGRLQREREREIVSGPVAIVSFAGGFPSKLRYAVRERA